MFAMTYLMMIVMAAVIGGGGEGRGRGRGVVVGFGGCGGGCCRAPLCHTRLCHTSWMDASVHCKLLE